MKKIYYLSTCDTCKRILGDLQPPGDYELQDIKENPVSSGQLDELRQLAGSYEALFSKRARLYRERGLHKETQGENEFRELLLDHYTFLKRPVIVANGKLFIGNTKKVITAAKNSIHP
jgi:arsenate reductase (glutaredoxin)